jgi:hypothetical protein
MGQRSWDRGTRDRGTRGHITDVYLLFTFFKQISFAFCLADALILYIMQNPLSLSTFALSIECPDDTSGLIPNLVADKPHSNCALHTQQGSRWLISSITTTTTTGWCFKLIAHFLLITWINYDLLFSVFHIPFYCTVCCLGAMHLKGTVARDFLASVFFMDLLYIGPRFWG